LLFIIETMLQLINKKQIKKSKTATKGGILLVAVLCFFVCLFSFNFVYAQIDTGLSYAEQTGLPTTDIREIVANIIRAALGLLGIIAVVIILYGGWLWMSAGGNEEQIAKAKKVLLNGAVGLLIILSAYSLVLFVMKMLGIGEGGGGDNNGGGSNQIGTVNMYGSGALGEVIKDHYPVRNQKDVPRNTKIAVTFYMPISTSSVADESGLLKDSIRLVALIPSSTAKNGIEERTYTDGAKVIFFETVSKEDNNKKEVYTLAISPNVLLGSSEQKINYAVTISSGVLKENGKSVFENARGAKLYRWYFVCDTINDEKPPHVVGVYPRSSDTNIPKNSVIQINFDEPMFPNGQVGFEELAETDYFVDKTNTEPIIYLKTGKSTVPKGYFEISNQYKTLEFISTDKCGANACGRPIYCLPVCDKAGATCQKDTYQILLRAASVSGAENKPKFYSEILDGFADLSGNALDGDNDGEVDKNKIVLPFSNQSKEPDNYFWSFDINNNIDATSPRVENLTIGPERQTVLANEELKIYWSKTMRFSSLYKDGISLQESPIQKERTGFVPTSLNDETGKTATEILHDPFLDGINITYIPEINSNVEDVNYNCFYPASGPGENNVGVCNGPYCCNGVGQEISGNNSLNCYNSLK